MDKLQILLWVLLISTAVQASGSDSMWLVNGGHRCEGRLYLLYNGAWGTVCDNHWDLVEDEMVCRMLNCGPPVPFTEEPYFGVGNGRILLSDVQCRGTEDSLFNCAHSGILVNECDHKSDVLIRCATIETMQLVSGVHSCEGRLEIMHDNAWTTVCDSHWDSVEAEMVCKMLGCGRALPIEKRHHYGPGKGKILLNELHCVGTEDNLLKCPHSGLYTNECTHRNDVGVSCLPMDSMRLVDGVHSCEGRLEVLYEGAWGTVCDTNWESHEAEMVCRLLQCGPAVPFQKPPHYGPGTGKILLNDLKCDGNEANLFQCPHGGIDNNACDHRSDVGVRCLPLDAMRLANGAHSCEGRLEVLHRGAWGTVCESYWDKVESQMACRMLGCGPEIFYGKPSWFGPGKGIVYLNELRCIGTERSLFDCPYVGLNNNRCKHGSDVGVRCGPVSSVRLVNGKNHCEGRLEFLYARSIWGTVCKKGWGDHSSEVVCRELGCGPPVQADTPLVYTEANIDIILSNVDCTGVEPSLAECANGGFRNHDCDHTQDVRVSCSVSKVIRLQDGGHYCRGRLEVLHNGSWDSVCNMGWTDTNTEVVCSEIGCHNPFFFGAITFEYNTFGVGKGEIIMSEVDCAGGEKSLLDCRHSGFYNHKCSHSLDVGVNCLGPKSNPISMG